MLGVAGRERNRQRLGVGEVEQIRPGRSNIGSSSASTISKRDSAGLSIPIQAVEADDEQGDKCSFSQRSLGQLPLQ